MENRRWTGLLLVVGAMAATACGQDVVVDAPRSVKGSSFAPPVTYPAGGAVAVGDLDGDGHVDLAAANGIQDSVSVLLNQSKGTFVPGASYAVGALSESIGVGDVDGDGKLDLVTANLTSSDVSVLLNEGKGLFAAKVTYPVGESPRGMAMGDLDGDGRLDLVTANGDYSASVLLNTGKGAFAPQVNYPLDGHIEAVAVGDLDGDGKLDLAFASSTAEGGGVSVLLNDGKGTFGPQVSYPGGCSSAYSIAVGDLNGDGKLDLALTCDVKIDIGGVSVLLNRGDGVFASPLNYTVGPDPYSVAVGDLNCDGKLDIVVADTNRADISPDPANSRVSVLLNVGNGTFGSEVPYPVGAQPWSVAVADLNGDGKLDIVTGNLSPDSVTVLLNTCQSSTE